MTKNRGERMGSIGWSFWGVKANGMGGLVRVVVNKANVDWSNGGCQRATNGKHKRIIAPRRVAEVALTVVLSKISKIPVPSSYPFSQLTTMLSLHPTVLSAVRGGTTSPHVAGTSNTQTIIQTAPSGDSVRGMLPARPTCFSFLGINSRRGWIVFAG